MFSIKRPLILALCALATAWASAQTLRVGLAEDPDVLDPTLARTFVGRIVFAALYGLFLFDEQLPWIGWMGMWLIIASGIASTVLRTRAVPDSPAEEH